MTGSRPVRATTLSTCDETRIGVEKITDILGGSTSGRMFNRFGMTSKDPPNPGLREPPRLLPGQLGPCFEHQTKRTKRHSLTPRNWTVIGWSIHRQPGLRGTHSMLGNILSHLADSFFAVGQRKTTTPPASYAQHYT